MESKATPATVGHVDAIFGGRRVRFELARDVGSVLALEKELGSLMAAGLRLEGNNGWTLHEVRTILAKAYPPEKRNALDALKRVKIPAGLGLTPPPPEPQRGVDPLQMIDPVLSAAPTGTYRQLAVLILEGLMLGLSPEKAVWDERQTMEWSEAAT